MPRATHAGITHAASYSSWGAVKPSGFRVVSAGMALLSDAEIEQRLDAVEGWERQGESIEREWRFADFAEAVSFVDRVAEIAETANHHPDILLHAWNRVRLTLSTHSQDGLTEADFQLAAQIDRAA